MCAFCAQIFEIVEKRRSGGVLQRFAMLKAVKNVENCFCVMNALSRKKQRQQSTQERKLAGKTALDKAAAVLLSKKAAELCPTVLNDVVYGSLQRVVAFNLSLDLFKGVDHGGVVAAEFVAYAFHCKPRYLADYVNCYLPRV